jgi:hypothetical protein
METISACRALSFSSSCFQFVKRMNGNINDRVRQSDVSVHATCFQFVKRMNGNGGRGVA